MGHNKRRKINILSLNIVKNTNVRGRTEIFYTKASNDPYSTFLGLKFNVPTAVVSIRKEWKETDSPLGVKAAKKLSSQHGLDLHLSLFLSLLSSS